MSSVAEIAAKTACIGEKAGCIAASLECEAQEMSTVMGRIQTAFGDQQSGQAAVLRLNSGLMKLVTACTALHDAKTHGADFVAKISG